MKPSYFLKSLPLLIAFVAASITAQDIPEKLSFQHIPSGMSQSSATVIFEDSNGFLWLGTPNGINRYNGTEFRVFEKAYDGNTGLSNGYIKSIYEDSDKLLYIGTNSGLNTYDKYLDAIKPYDFIGNGKQIASNIINTITKIGDHLFLGTAENGLYRYNIQSGETERFSFSEPTKALPNDNYIVDVFEFEDDKIVLVTQASVYLVDKELNKSKIFSDTEFYKSALKIDDTSLLIGSREGNLLKLNIENNEISEVNHIKLSTGYAVLDMEKDAKGNVWIGTENQGLFIYSLNTDSISSHKSNFKKPNSISNNSIWSLCKTKNGVMWMGPFKKGLSFYDPSFYKFDSFALDPFDANSLSNNIVNCFSEDEKGNIWIGTDGGGLNYWNRSNNRFTHFSLNNGKLNTNVILSILPDIDDKLWLGSWAGGITIFDPKDFTYENMTSKNSFLASDNVMDLLQDREGNIWIATLFGGLQIYNPATKKHETIKLKSNIDGKEVTSVARLMEDNDGALWAGTQTMGVFKVTKKNTEWDIEQFHSKDQERTLSNDFVNTILQDDFGNIWVGTLSGLNKYLPLENRFKIINEKDGLITNVISGIVQAENSLWLSTDSGIIKYNLENENFLNYDIYDGLQGNEFNGNASFKTYDDKILFGGNNGFNLFSPKQAKKKKENLDILLTKLKIFNNTIRPNDGSGVLKKDIAMVDSITLSHEHAVFDLSFRALTLKGAEKVNYAYFLEGLETEWNYVGDKNSATYTNLNPGSYTFHIKSTNSDGLWGDTEKKLVITIIPPFWATWWFKTALIVAIALLVYLVYYIRIQNIKRDKLKLEQQVEDRTKEIRIQQNKLKQAAEELSIKNEEIQRFVFAVSHDLKSPLNSIEVMANFISEDIDENEQPETIQYLTFINKSCAIMKNLISDITEIAKLGKIENKNEVLDSSEIIQTASNMAIGRFKQQKAELIIGENLPKIYGDRNRLIQVFENLIDNAIKYMGDQEKPVVEITSKNTAQFHEFLVSDNGSGMDAKALEKLFGPFQRFHTNTEGTGLGLYMIKKIINSHNGAIWAESEGKGKGTTFVLQLPRAEAA